MSGGKFDYWQHHINYIAESIQSILDNQGKKKPASGFYEFESQEFEVFSPEVEEKIREGLAIIRRAYIYAHRIDWFLSGDDGDENFLKRLEEELDRLDNERKEERTHN